MHVAGRVLLPGAGLNLGARRLAGGSSRDPTWLGPLGHTSQHNKRLTGPATWSLLATRQGNVCGTALGAVLTEVAQDNQWPRRLLSSLERFSIPPLHCLHPVAAPTRQHQWGRLRSVASGATLFLWHPCSPQRWVSSPGVLRDSPR